MKSLLQGILVILLLGLYAVVLWALLHPRVSDAYRAYYIDRTMVDWNPPHYASNPEEGALLNREGFPDWIDNIHGFSFREGWGRWTDANVAPISRIIFNNSYNGELCVEFTARSVPWVVGKTLGVSMGGESRSVTIQSGLSDYRIQFDQLKNARELDLIPPPHLPKVRDMSPGALDPRRLAINVAMLRLIRGSCAHATSPTLGNQ